MVGFFFFPLFDEVSVAVRLFCVPGFDFFFPFEERRFFVFLLDDDDALDEDEDEDDDDDDEVVFAFL